MCVRCRREDGGSPVEKARKLVLDLSNLEEKTAESLWVRGTGRRQACPLPCLCLSVCVCVCVCARARALVYVSLCARACGVCVCQRERDLQSTCNQSRLGVVLFSLFTVS